ncbi:unnamed protein product [Closterium sp. Naga37s-1]|nr:unnamed protein product [Closterium sp. Naga37s-1]
MRPALSPCPFPALSPPPVCAAATWHRWTRRVSPPKCSVNPPSGSYAPLPIASPHLSSPLLTLPRPSSPLVSSLLLILFSFTRCTMPGYRCFRDSIASVTLSSPPVVPFAPRAYHALPSPPFCAWRQVEYHQDKCEPCMQFAPEVAKVADSLKGLVKVGAINCNKAPDVCMQAQIKELPAFRLYPWEVKANPYTRKRYKDAPQVFTGDNTAKALVSFATAALPHDLVVNISSGASADAFLAANATLNKVVLFSTKPAVTPLFKALSLQFRKRLVFAQAKSTDEALAASFGAASFPALFLHKADGTRQLYEGPLKPEPIAAFLEQFAAPAEPAADSATAGGADASGAGAAGEESQARWVRQMRAANVSSQVLQREEMWMVALTSSAEECREVKEKFEKTAEELVGMIFVGVVDMHTDEDAKSLASKYGVKEPCGEALLFPLGDDKEENEPDRMPLAASLKAMTAAVYALAPDSFVRHITADSLEVFAQTNPLQPKVFLFTNKRDTPGMYKVLSTTFRKDASFALVHESEKKVVARFKVAKFPHMSIMFPAPSPGREGEVQLTVRDFPGPLKYHTVAPQLMQLVATARQFAAPTAEIVALGEGKEGQEDGFQTECVDSNRLCVIGIFNTDSPLDQLKRVAAKWLRGGQFVFMWLDVGRHKALASRVLPLLGVNQQDLPTAVVVSPRKMRCAVLPEAFSPPILDAFLDSLLAGRVRTFALDHLPSFLPGPSVESSQAAEAAEEAAEPEPIAEEEFDLADIMSEQVEDADAVASKEHKILQADKEAEEEAARKAAEVEAAKKASKKKKKKSKSKKSKAVDSDVRDEL